MKLPDGYAAENHWAWSMADPGFRSEESSTWAWQELDGTYLLGEDIKEEVLSLRAILKGNSYVELISVPGMIQGDSDSSESDTSSKTSGSLSLTTSPTNSPGRVVTRDSRELLRKDNATVIDIRRNLQLQIQRQRVDRTEPYSSLEQKAAADEESCACTECQSRRWRGETSTRPGQKPYTSIRTRLNGISF